MVAIAGRRWGALTAQERREARQAALIRTAVGLFGAEGYHNTSVKAVCLASGLTERYFYESFVNREELLRACFSKVSGELISRMREAADAAPGGPMDRVRAGLLVYLSELKTNPQAARVFLIEIASVSPETEKVVEDSLDAFGALLMDTLFGQNAWRTRSDPLLLRGAVGGGLHIARAWIASGHREPLEVIAVAALKLYAVVGAQDVDANA